MAIVREGILKTDLIVDYILSLIRSKTLTLNSPAPSINNISKEFGVANETVVKAYKKLKARGILTSIPAKGFYVSKTNFSEDHSIFVLFDSLNPYREVLYYSMLKEFGKKASLDIFFHHRNRFYRIDNSKI